MADPRVVGRKSQDVRAGERVDDALREVACAHVGERGGIDPVGGNAAHQIAQERKARFARAGAKHRKAVGADLRAEARLAGVARAGVVDRDEGRACQARAQHARILGAERVQIGVMRRTSCRLEIATPRPVSSVDPLEGHLALDMEHPDQATQLRAIAADNPRQKRCDDLSACCVSQRRADRASSQSSTSDPGRRCLRSPCAANPPALQPSAPPSDRSSAWTRRGRAAAAPPTPLQASTAPLLSPSPDGFSGGRGGNASAARSRPSASGSRSSAEPLPTTALHSPPEAAHLAEQIANQADQFGRSLSVQANHRGRRHPQLKLYFQAVGTPPPPGNLPRLPTRCAS